MTSVVTGAALVTAAGGVISFVVAAVWARAWRQGLHMALDLWIAAGLLRLHRGAQGVDLLVVASIVAVRQLIGYGLRLSDHALAGVDQHGGRGAT